MVDLFTYRVGSTTRSHTVPPRFYPSKLLRERGCNYASVYAVREEDAKAIEEAGTTSQFKGVVWSQRLWADFDSKESFGAAQSFLKEQGYDFTVWDTGGDRGGHLGILRTAQPSHLLPQRDKAWAVANLPGCDAGLYWHLHLIRLPSALHETSGKPKVCVARHPGRELILPPWQEREMRALERPVLGTHTPVGRKSIFQDWKVMERLTPMPGQSRHRQLLLLATAVKEAQGTPEEARWLCGELNKAFDDGKGLEELDRLVQWTYSQG